MAAIIFLFQFAQNSCRLGNCFFGYKNVHTRLCIETWIFSYQSGLQRRIRVLGKSKRDAREQYLSFGSVILNHEEIYQGRTVNCYALKLLRLMYLKKHKPTFLIHKFHYLDFQKACFHVVLLDFCNSYYLYITREIRLDTVIIILYFFKAYLMNLLVEQQIVHLCITKL